MRKRIWAARAGKYGLLKVLCVLSAAGLSAVAQSPAATPAPAQEKQPAATAPERNTPASPREKAWGILREALREDSADKRAKAVRALGLLPRNPEAGKAAVGALRDDKSSVRLAAAAALGSMHAEHAAAELVKVLNDSEPVVVLAAANSLLLLRDDAGYDVYYGVLTGERRANKGLIKGQLDTLKDKKKMAKLDLRKALDSSPLRE